MSEQQTVAHQLVDVLWADRYGYKFADWVADRRSEGATWRQVAREVTARTGVDFNHATLINWFPELTRGRAA